MSTCHCSWHTRHNPMSSDPPNFCWILDEICAWKASGSRFHVRKCWIKGFFKTNQTETQKTKSLLLAHVSLLWVGASTLLTKFVAQIVFYLSIYGKTACYFGITLVAFVLWRLFIPKGAAFCFKLNQRFCFSQGLLQTFRYLKSEVIFLFGPSSVKDCWLY